MLSKNILYYGKKDDLPKIIHLRAGPLTLNYQNGEISKIIYEDVEAVQRIYANIRDKNWGTVPNRITAEKVKNFKDSFVIDFDVDSKLDEIDFLWRANITGKSEGKIVFSFDGISQSTFMTCRIGFCISHPLKTCIGRKCLVENDSGNLLIGSFPELIAPGEIPPFLDMRSMAYDIKPGIKVKISFEGDLFEMEDQRNWTDASFKTFCTPLRFECPRKITPGTRISQKVILELITTEENTISQIKDEDKIILIDLGTNVSNEMPHMGLGFNHEIQILSTVEINRIKALHLNHLRLEIFGNNASNKDEIINQFNLLNILNMPLEVVLYLQNPENELPTLFNYCRNLNTTIVRWIIFEKGKHVTTKNIIEIARKYIHKFDKDAIVGGGSDADFYELNSQKAPFDLMDFICYSINPQVHRNDMDSMIENLATPKMTVDSAITISSGKPIVISPITLKQRFNPVAIEEIDIKDKSKIPPEVDIRQMSLFGACWTLGCLSNLLPSQVSSLTFYEMVGWRGVMETRNGSLLPDKFYSFPECVFPMYHVFADMGEFHHGTLISTTNSDTSRIASLGLLTSTSKQLLLANLSQFKQTVVIRGMDNALCIRFLDETNVIQAMRNPEDYRSKYIQVDPINNPLKIHLLPFSYTRIINPLKS